MRLHRWGWVVFTLLLTQAGLAQGTLEDYQRAERFLPDNVKHLVTVADVRPHWIDKTNRFWYRRVDTKGSTFILVDAEHNSAVPAFDHDKLAAALARLSKREYSATDLPFHDIDFVEDAKSVSFETAGRQWTCSLSDYDCKASPAEDTNQSLSPDKRWAAFVKDHNLFLRNVSTGAVSQLTRDGERAWDYATPLPWLKEMIEQGTEDVKQAPTIFWSPDSSKLLIYRIDSRNVTRLPSIQYVPPDQLRPKAFSVAYTLPGEDLPKAYPIIFDSQSGTRVDVKTAPLEMPSQEGPDAGWSSDSKTLFYDYDDRGFKAKEIRTIDPQTGEQKY